jgi:DNA-binding NtrC family response regulator
VRELKHIVERAVVLSRDPALLRKEDIELAPAPGEDGGASFREAKARVVASFERRYVEKMLANHRGNVSRAAAAAGKHRRAFWELVRKHDIDADRFRDTGGTIPRSP